MFIVIDVFYIYVVRLLSVDFLLVFVLDMCIYCFVYDFVEFEDV